MSGLFSRGQAMLVRNQKATSLIAGGTVTFSQKSSGQSVTVAAWVGRKRFVRNQTDPGPAVIYGDRDYLIGVDDLATAGITGSPLKGDRIIEAGVGTFELMPPDTGLTTTELSDNGRTVYRCHTKKVA